MLLNKNFLLQLDQQQNIEKYARITLLTNKELPIEQIEGRITSGGSISIDGNSAIRRTCSLTMVSQDTNYHAHYWTLKSKFKLEIGIRNNVNFAYPDIIWFPQGIYVFTSFSTSHSINNFTISLQGKDKGCLINGEINGSFNSSVDLGTIEEIDEEGNSTITKLELKDIIINMMHQYAGEPFKNIIVNDLDEIGFELLEYRYNKDLFLYRKEGSQIYDNMFFADTAPTMYKVKSSEDSNRKAVDFTDENIEGLETLVETLDNSSSSSSIFYSEDDEEYRVARIQYGQTAGYKIVNLVYAGDLVASVGDSIASILDKIKNMLGQYEYFYDVEGRFIFQKKRYYVNSPIGKEGNKEEVLPQQEEIAYTLTGMKTVSTFGNNPNLSNVKNDFSIWGERKTEADVAIPIHLRYAIDEKPTEYTCIEVADSEVSEYNAKYKAKLTGQKKIKYIAGDAYSADNPEEIICDWREIIYQMALDHFKYSFLDDFELKIISANEGLYSTGMTGYEQYYIDILGFWRDLYFPQILSYEEEKQNIQSSLEMKQNELKQIEERIAQKNQAIQVYEKENAELAKIIPVLETPKVEVQEKAEKITRKFFSMRSIPESISLETPEVQVKQQEALITPIIEVIDYQIKLEAPIITIREEVNQEKAAAQYMKNIRKIARLMQEIQAIEEAERKPLIDRIKTLSEDLKQKEKQMENKNSEDYFENGWNKKKDLAPELLNFWFDFLDNDSSVTSYGVQKIGARAKPINDNNIKAIYFRNTPDVIFDSSINNTTAIQGYKYLQIPELDTLFAPSTQGKSAKDELDTLLYNHLFTADSVSISAKPVYYLEPNTKIRIVDEDTNTSGDYIITRLSLPLAYNGTMSITANRAVKNIL